MTETVVLFIIGSMIGMIQLLTAAILTYIMFEIRGLRSRVHKLEGAIGFIEGFLRKNGLIDTRTKIE